MTSKNIATPVANSQELILQPMVLTIGDLVRLKQTNQITIPNAYQRRYQAWKLDKFSSFIIGNWRGFSAKDSYIIVDVQACYDNEISSNIPNQEFLEHLKDYLDNGHTFLAVDGQHRIESSTEYVNGKVPKFNKGVDQTLLLHDSKVNLKIEFMSLPNQIRDFYLNQPVIVSMVTKATLPSLKQLFVTANDGIPLKKIEKGMAGNAPNAVDGILELVGIEHYREFLCKVSGIKSVTKTDCELVAKLLNFEHDRESVNMLPAAIEYLFHTDMDGYKPTTKADIKRLNKNFTLLFDSLSTKIGNDGKKKFNLGQFTNAYMLISLITDTRNHSLMEHYFGNNTRFKIEDPIGFGEWFLKSELKRMTDKFMKDENGKDLYITIEKPIKENGVVVMKTTKSPVENIEGYNYATTREGHGDFMTFRQDRMLSNFRDWLNSPDSIGVVKEYDTTAITESIRERVIVESNFKSSAGKDLSWSESMNGKAFQVDHVVARDNQGGIEIGNLQLMDSKSNRSKSNKEI